MRRWIWRVLLLTLVVAALTGTAMAADSDIVVKNNIKYDLSTGTVLGSDNRNITTASIKASVRGENITKIADGAFSGFKGLASVTIPSTITQIGKNAFRNCEKLDNVVIPENVATVGTGAFYGCKGLKTLTFRDNVSLSADGTPTVQSITTIQSEAFAWCENLKTLNLSGSISVIGDRAFNNCKNSLTDVVIPEGVVTIGEEAFAQCTKLKLLSIPSTVSHFDHVILGGNNNLEAVHYGGSVDTILPGLPDSLKGTGDEEGKYVHTTTRSPYNALTPTCTDTGFVEESTTCEKNCTGLNSRRELPKLEHRYKWSKASDTQNPKICEDQNWTYTGICQLCGHTTTEHEVITAAPHTPVEPSTETIVSKEDPTCGENGYKVVATQICSICQKVLTTNTEVLEATGKHLEDNVIKTRKPIKEATCIENGTEEVTVTCGDCGKVVRVVEKEIPATGIHTWDEIKWTTTTEPTCMQKGEEEASQVCKICGNKRDVDELKEELKEKLDLDSITREIAAPGHSWKILEERVTKEPTCSEEGIKTVKHICENEKHVEPDDANDNDGPKEETVEESIPELPHTPEKSDQIIEPTCTTDGMKITYPTTCKVCGDKINEEEEPTKEIIPATGHKWGDPEPDPENKDKDKAPTCGEAGVAYVTVKCTACGETSSQELTLPATGEHDWDKWETDKDDNTKEIRACKVCEATETRNISTTTPDDPTDDPSGGDSSDDKPSGGDSSGGTTTPAPTRYNINLIQASNGSVSASASTAEAGDRITLTVWAGSGYELDQVWVRTSGGSVRNLTSLGGDQYRFTMPAADVEVRATFTRSASSRSDSYWPSASSSSSSSRSDTTPVQTPVQSVPRASAWGQRFSDVPSSHWAAGEINWANQMGYMNGGKNGFDPDGTITFQQLWMVLARLTGSRPTSMEDAKRWAVTGGFAEGAAPNGAVSRHQLVTALYRCAHLMGSTNRNTTSLAGYADSRTVPASARDAFSWAVANGIIGGTSSGRLDPNGTLTRAQFSVILYRFSQRI